MRSFIFSVVALLLLPNSVYAQIHIDNGRYEIVKTDHITILLDKDKGITWRNVKCADNEPANCWEKMDYIGSPPQGLNPSTTQNKSTVSPKTTGINIPSNLIEVSPDELPPEVKAKMLKPLINTH